MKINKEQKQFIRDNYNLLSIVEITKLLDLKYNDVYNYIRSFTIVKTPIKVEVKEDPKPIINRPAAVYSNPQWCKLYENA